MDDIYWPGGLKHGARPTASLAGLDTAGLVHVRGGSGVDVIKFIKRQTEVEEEKEEQQEEEEEGVSQSVIRGGHQFIPALFLRLTA
jgi:hypothetical protein